MLKINNNALITLIGIVFLSMVTSSCVSKVKTTYLSSNVRLIQFYEKDTDSIKTSKIEKYNSSTNYWYDAERLTDGSYEFTSKGLKEIQQDELGNTDEDGGDGGNGGGGY